MRIVKITEAKLRQIIREELAQDEQLNEFVGGLSAKSKARKVLDKLSSGTGTVQDRDFLEKFLVDTQMEKGALPAGPRDQFGEPLTSYEEHTKGFIDALQGAEEGGDYHQVDAIKLRAIDFIDGKRKNLELPKGR